MERKAQLGLDSTGIILRPTLKGGFWVERKAFNEKLPEAYYLYVEDSFLLNNAALHPKSTL